MLPNDRIGDEKIISNFFVKFANFHLAFIKVNYHKLVVDPNAELEPVARDDLEHMFHREEGDRG